MTPSKIKQTFSKDYPIYWANLSRLNQLLVILNISLFFLTNLVTYENYYYTYFSLLALGGVQLALLLPTGLLDRMWFYGICVAAEAVALYFLVASVWYWVATHSV